MLFQSQTFILLFLPAVLVSYYFLAHWRAAREAALIVASLIFYGWWDPRFLPLLIGQTVVTWLIAELYLFHHRQILIIFGIAANLAVLALFKYALFLSGTFTSFLGLSTPKWTFVLPLGISFYTFELISYLVDLRRGEGHHYSMREFCLFIFLFPHLIAGPIIRHNEIIPQFRESPLRPGLNHRLSLGIAFFVVGFAKKVFLADSLADIVDPIFATQHIQRLSDAWLGAMAFTFQLFLDFSAYSEMAIGIGLMLGFRFPDNFEVPYRATDLRQFWRRWHMTLSRFLRDYLYIPLGGSLHGKAVYVKATLITMGLCGLWHGAGWTFVAWGLMHGLGLIVCRFWQKSGRELATPLAWAATLLFVVLGWVLFRSGDFSSAARMFAGMIGLGGFVGEFSWPPVLAAAATVSLLGPSTREFVEMRLRPLPAYGVAFGLFAVLALLQVGQGQPQTFIYFQF